MPSLFVCTLDVPTISIAATMYNDKQVPVCAVCISFLVKRTPLTPDSVIPRRYSAYLGDYIPNYIIYIDTFVIYTNIRQCCPCFAQADVCFPERSSNIYSKTISSQHRPMRISL